MKWVGGKGQLLHHLTENAPPQVSGYHEPFLGGGAFFFGLSRSGRLKGRRISLTDINQELVDAYCSLRDEVELVIEALAEHRYDKSYYYDVRAQDPFELSTAERAARMIFLNRTGFNGLYRVNRSGQFNVPFGRYKNPRICDEENLRAVARALAGVDIQRTRYDSILERAKSGDFVYFDPPYVPASNTANFVSYAKDGFTAEDQSRLSEVFSELADRGVYVMLSNSDTDLVRKLYRKHQTLAVEARRSVNSNSTRRGPVGEVIVTSYQPKTLRSRERKRAVKA